MRAKRSKKTERLRKARISVNPPLENRKHRTIALLYVLKIHCRQGDKVGEFVGEEK